MTHFKLTYSRKPQPSSPPGADMLWQQGNLRIEGSQPRNQWRNQLGDTFLLIGHLVGDRKSSGQAERHSPPLNTAVAEQPSDLKQLEGRFVVIKVSADNACEMWTDQHGRVDAYYQTTPDGVVIGSDLNQLPVSSEGDRLDQIAAAHSLVVYGYRPPKKQTLYASVSRLGIGESIRLRDGNIEIHERPFTPAPIVEYEPSELHRYADLFLEAVRARASAALNIVSLSSGWDSTSILAALVHLFGKQKVRCAIGRLRYSDRSGDINKFEIDRAKAVADYFGVPLDIVEYDFGVNGSRYLDETRQLLQANQLATISALGNYRMYDHIARHYGSSDTSFFTGEASDGAHNFGFSQLITMFHPASFEFREYADKMATFLYGPTFLKELYGGTQEADPVWRIIRGASAASLFDEPAREPAAINRQMLASLFLSRNRTPFYSLKNVRLLTANGRDEYLQASHGTYFGRMDSFAPETVYSWYLHLYHSFYWQSSPVFAREVMADSHDVRLANPFQDYALLEFLAAMPESWGRGLNLNPTKYPLKWMLANRIDYPMHLQVGPHSYTYDVMPGFSISGELLHASDLTNAFKTALKRRGFRDLLDPQIFDVAYIERLVQSYLDGAELRGDELTDMFSLATHAAVGVYGSS